MLEGLAPFTCAVVDRLRARPLRTTHNRLNQWRVPRRSRCSTATYRWALSRRQSWAFFHAAHLPSNAPRCSNQTIETGVLHDVGLRIPSNPIRIYRRGKLSKPFGLLPSIQLSSPRFALLKREVMPKFLAVSRRRSVPFFPLVRSGVKTLALASWSDGGGCVVAGSGSDGFEPACESDQSHPGAGKAPHIDHHHYRPWRHQGRLSA